MSSSRLSARGRAQGSAARMSKPDRDALNGADAAAEASAAFSAQQPPHIDTNLFHDRVLPGLQDPPSPDTVRFMVATDNHLGYCEADPIRRDDSFRTFEELLHQATRHHCDFVLLGGDLFHENKPSRPTLFRAIHLLRSAVLGDRPVALELLSDGKRNFPLTGHANYLDANVNIALPIFSIHGNHDDPAGVGQYSPMDILHEALLINYFGKPERVDRITNYPILFRKGHSKLALYGLGNVRDERLHRTFMSHEVKWVRPDETEGDWFNVAVLHQNRVGKELHGKAYISAKMLPDFLDLVVWGHEHEFVGDEASEEGSFVIVQPGSSVATSLCAAEAVDKHVCIIEIKGDQYRCLNLPLYTTRPFVISDITLSEHVDAAVPHSMEAIEQLLTEQIDNMLERVKAEPKYANSDRPSLPLIRVRVEHTGFARLNVSKFGQSFVNRVANPDDLLNFYKQRQPTARRERGDKTPLDLSALEQAAGRRGADDDVPGIDEILAQLMERTPLSVLSEDLLADAIEEYAHKRTTEVIADAVGKSLRDAQKELKADEQVREKGASLTPDAVIQLAKKRHDELRAQQLSKRPSRAKREGERDALEGIDARQLRAIGIKQQNDEDGDDDEDDEEEKRPRRRVAAGGGRAAAGSRARGGRGAAAAGAGRVRGGRQRSKVERHSDVDDEQQRQYGDGAAGNDDFDGEGDDGEMEWGEDDEKQPASSRRRQPAATQARGRRGGRAARRDEMEDEEHDAAEEADEVSPAPKRSRVKAEPAPRIPVGARNRGGELDFLAHAAGGGRQVRGGNRAAPRGRAVGGGGARADDNVVDLIED